LHGRPRPLKSFGFFVRLEVARLVDRVSRGPVLDRRPSAGGTVKRPYQPNTRKRAKRHGFRHRMSTRAGQAVLKARRLKGRRKLSA
jgi:large subunit ribosomal protein L34